VAGPLTERERELVGVIIRGCTNREIAEELVIAERTAVRHVANILNQLNLKRARKSPFRPSRGLDRLPSGAALAHAELLVAEEGDELGLTDDVAGHHALDVDNRRTRLERQRTVKREELEGVVVRWTAGGRARALVGGDAPPVLALQCPIR
jgi:alkylhydroperoxidase family enzyme